MNDLLKQAADALELALVDSMEVISTRVQNFGENYRPERLVDMRADLQRGKAVLAALRAQQAQAKSEPAASDESLMQILHDPENQPSQYGTVPMDWVPPGFWLAPDEPSEAMCKAAVIDFNGPAVYKSVAMEALAIEEGIYGDMYKAMRAAHLAAIAATQAETKA